MKVHFQRKFIVFALLIGIIVSLFAVLSIAANASTTLPEEGRSFTADDHLSPVKRLEQQPRTYEALFYAPSDIERTGILFGNTYDSSKYQCINFEIYSDGKPALFLTDEDKNRFSKCFDVDVRTNDWVHLVITHETTDSGSTFNCYVNGESVGTLSSEFAFEYDMEALQVQRLFALADDNRASTSRHFRGKIKNLALYSDVLTAEEIKASYEQGVSSENESLIAYYQLDNTEGATFIEDSSNNGYDLQPIMQPNDTPLDPSTYDYSFAIVGDTQNLIRPDVYNGTNYSDYQYDWIVANEESKKISYVIGLGDITDRDGVDQTSDDGIDQTDDEWELAVKQHNKLTEAEIPYAVIRGNHDGVKINDYFAGNDNFNNQDVCYYESNSLLNYYVRFTVGQEKYMVLCLDYDTTEDVLKWAGEEIEKNSEYRVIIATHAYLTNKLNFIDMFYTGSASRGPTDTINSCNGNQIWTDLASQYENVIMVLSGHVSVHDVMMREDVGVHGNTVYQFLIDPQGLDNQYDRKTGMVAMFYFSNGGKTVSVEYVSAYHTIENNDGYDYILNENYNKFTFDISEYQEVLPVECEYGTIDAKYASDTTYPFVVFKSDETFIGGYGELSEAIAAVSENGENEDYVILMRRNAELRDETVNLADFTGAITVDLGGYTLLKAQDGSVFSVNVEDNSSAAVDESGFDVGGTFVLKNGTVWKYGTNAVVSVNYGANLVNNYKVSFEFSGITFVNKNGTTCNILATLEDGGANGTDACVYPYAVFNDCTFDYTNSVDGSNMLALDSSDGYNRVIWDVNVNGGMLKAAEELGFSDFATLDSDTDGRDDTLVFAEGGDGERLKMQLPASIEEPLVVFASSEGNFRFVKDTEESGYAIYVLEEFDGLLTKYGVVPAEYLDTSLYPILLFQDGKFIKGFSKFCTNTSGATGDAIHEAKKLVDGNNASEIGGTVQLLFRDDVTVAKRYNNLCLSQGTIVIDLGGHEYTQSYDGPAFVSQIKYSNGFGDATVEVCNGYMVLKEQLLRCDCYGSEYSEYTTETEYKTLHINFDNVNFSYAAGAAATEFLCWFNDHSSSTDGTKAGYDVKFDDCTFDFTNAASMGTIMNANDSDHTKTNSVVNVRVNGGEIIAAKPMNSLYEINRENGSSVVFCMGSDGNYTKMTVVGSTEEPTVTANYGSLKFVKEGETDSEGRTTYVLTPQAVMTLYGEIPATYSDPEIYPFAVFKNGSFYKAYADWGTDSGNSALGVSKEAGSIILLRRDYVYNQSNDYHNLSQTRDNTVIDLGGFTFDSSAKYMFNAQKKTNYNTGITVKNGTIIIEGNALVALDTDKPNVYEGGYGFNFVFDGITVKASPNTSVEDVITYNKFVSNDKDQFLNLTFNDCTFDLSAVAKDLVLFDLSDAHSKNTVIISGGEIITSGYGLTIAEIDGGHAETTLAFGRNTDGDYTILSIPVGSTEIEDSFMTDDGVECVFVKVSADDTNANYTLYPAVMVGYKIKTSVTLYSNFVYNIYIPASDFNGVTVDGSAVDYEEVEVEVDGVTVKYYRVSISLPVAESLDDINLTVTLNSGSTTVDASWTLSVLDYAKSVLNGSYDEFTNNLVKDMLVYASAAYTYFGELESEKADEITTLLDGYTKDMPENAEAVNTTTTDYFSNVEISLYEVPSFRFYLNGSYTEDDFTFKVGTRNVEATLSEDGNALYIEVTMYAYMMLDTVSYTVTNKETGKSVTEEYNLYSYYAYITDSEKVTVDANLTALVEGLIKYSVSASAYRTSVIAAG